MQSVTGNNGKIIPNTIMGDDNSRTNKGILVIDAQGTSKTGNDAFSLSPESDGYRLGVGTIAAGAYDYTLAKGGNNGDAESWYLTSQEVKPLINSIPTKQVAGEEKGIKEEKPKTGGLRPEIGSYISNNRAMNTMFSMTLHDLISGNRYHIKCYGSVIILRYHFFSSVRQVFR